MKNLSYLILIPILFLACKKDDNALFRMEYPNNDFAIQAGLNSFDAHYFQLSRIVSNADSLFSFYKIDPANIEQIQPRSARLNSIFASSDYDFIREVEIRIFEDNPDNYQVLFYRDDVPFNTGKTLDLVPNAVDIQEIVKKEKFGIVIRMELRELSPEFIESRLDFSFSVL